MRIRILASVLLTGFLVLQAAQAVAQTPTFTRRPTPEPTATHTETPPAGTPTPPPGGTSVFLCSGGPNDGAQCNDFSDCPNGACVLSQGVCDGGDNDGGYCASPDDCPTGQCVAAQRVCLSGDDKGNSCLRDDQCDGSTCVSTGLFCNGGDLDGFSCVDDGGCVGAIEDGQCQAPAVFLCSAGQNNGGSCNSNLDCPAGACVIAQMVCQSGSNDGFSCESAFDCPGGTCIPTARVCSAGTAQGQGCLSDANCPSASCIATGVFCDGGFYDSLSCVNNANCSPDGEQPADCVSPGPDYYCSAGDNDGQSCSDDSDCPNGACVLSQGVCDTTGSLCDSNGDCNGGNCIQTQKVCLGGDNLGVACLNDGNCGSGVTCGSSGLFCDGGDFDSLSCAQDGNCCIDDGCTDATHDGSCDAPDVTLCSGGANDNQTCEGHSDCPGGACVDAQRVCDGGGTDFDGFSCEGSVDCNGAPCVATSHICIRGDDEGYGCLRDAHCSNGGTGSCEATGLVCDGDTTNPDYDPFWILSSCVNDNDCQSGYSDPALSCVAPTQEGPACSAGTQDGQPCNTDADCPQGKCVLQEGLCDSGSRDMQLCDTPADCPGSTCKATQRVCAQSGSYCVDDNDCNSGEHCVSTGLVCIGGSFDSFSCADDSDCYDPTDPDDVQGACTGLTPRACSLQAPCELQGDANGDVYGLAFDPTVSPATFDFYVVPIVNGAAGAVVVLRPHNDDADLYVGPQVKPTILSPTDYPFTSNNVGETTDFVRIDSYSDPTYANFIAGLSEFAAAVVGSGGEPNYTIEALFLGPSQSGDGNCDGTVNSEDVEGFIDVPFDPAARLTDESSPFARCVGADSNQDGSETAADFVATVRNIAGSAS